MKYKQYKKQNIKYKIQYYLTFTELVCKLMHSCELRECCPQCFLFKKKKKERIRNQKHRNNLETGFFFFWCLIATDRVRNWSYRGSNGIAIFTHSSSGLAQICLFFTVLKLMFKKSSDISITAELAVSVDYVF